MMFAICKKSHGNGRKEKLRVPMDTDDSSESDESPSDKSDTSTDDIRLYFI